MELTFATALHIRKVRHLENIEIPLDGQHRKNLILTGKNGSGKTSVLEELVSHLEYIVSEAFHSEDECRTQIMAFEKMIRQLTDSEQDKRHSISIQSNKKAWECELKNWTAGAVVDWTSLALMREKYKEGTFILASFGDRRNIEVEISKNIVKVDLHTVYGICAAPVRDLAKYLVNLKSTRAFALEKGDQKRAQQIGEWFDRFQNILRKIYHDPSLVLDFDIENYRFNILINGRQPFDFNSMSMGYSAVFDIIGNLIMRMESQHRYDLEGIVLIDEIETHLHVELQKDVLPILTELFPNLQFIISTHSPFVISSAENAVIYDLENHLLVENGLTNLPYEGIVEGYFGADLLSQELREKFEEYRELAVKPQLTLAEYARIGELEMYLDEVPDYLALPLSSEYHQLKLELDKRGKRHGKD